ncbi:MAG: VapC toxin family PIN domain ribonuclease [Mycobacterium sp.]|jgi:toxin-antitoxin system PIN domain toxin|nr:VapC toxin family PIN domain ribonuclease [Mycobacterium sp.]
MQFARDLGKPAASRDDHQSHRFGLPWQTLAAFLRTVTHPRVAENMLCAADSWRYVADWLAAPVVWIPPATENTARVWARLREQVEVTGNLVPDAQLAATAVEHETELVSAETDFMRLPGLRWINPLSASPLPCRPGREGAD